MPRLFLVVVHLVQDFPSAHHVEPVPFIFFRFPTLHSLLAPHSASSKRESIEHEVQASNSRTLFNSVVDITAQAVIRNAVPLFVTMVVCSSSTRHL
ncbi:hypothetical protein L208DRAFT_1405109 [Tricholoma matsutake]|nr:hypothetical protein L208DRAFT_1405109 [Tricholoma matsutake 945]